MANLIIDIGNSFVKLAVFECDNLIDVTVEKDLTEIQIEAFFQKYTIKKGIYSSVRANEYEKRLLKNYNFLPLTYLTPLPLQLNYKTPKTLGLDRIAAVVGAENKHKNSNLLVIDIGTCITYDFINSKKEYLGGAIAPGFEMRFKALNYFTDKLPLIKFDAKKLKHTGDTTETSIISGVYNGIKNEIEGTIKSYNSQYEGLKIVVTGGDLNLFDLASKNRIFANEFLVLEGLNEILKYNAE